MVGSRSPTVGHTWQPGGAGLGARGRDRRPVYLGTKVFPKGPPEPDGLAMGRDLTHLAPQRLAMGVA